MRLLTLTPTLMWRRCWSDSSLFYVAKLTTWMADTTTSTTATTTMKTETPSLHLSLFALKRDFCGDGEHVLFVVAVLIGEPAA
jgi:hypothetical protein